MATGVPDLLRPAALGGVGAYPARGPWRSSRSPRRRGRGPGDGSAQPRPPCPSSQANGGLSSARKPVDDADRKRVVEGKRVEERVDLGGTRVSKKKKKTK